MSQWLVGDLTAGRLIQVVVDEPACFIAIHYGHVDIEQDCRKEVDWLGAHLLHCFNSIFSGENLEILLELLLVAK